MRQILKFTAAAILLITAASPASAAKIYREYSYYKIAENRQILPCGKSKCECPDKNLPAPLETAAHNPCRGACPYLGCPVQRYQTP